MPLIVPYFAQDQTAAIVIDGVTYRVPLIDSGGRVYVNAKAKGASEVKCRYAATEDPSTTRKTVLTPTSGTKVRLVACHVHIRVSTSTRIEVYFGTGAGITTDPAKAILYCCLDASVAMTFGMTWPDGAGPVGDADEVVSLRTSGNITTDGHIVLHYREE